MFSLELIRDLYAQMEWADALVWNAVAPIPEESAELTERLYHIYFTQSSFLRLWTGKPGERYDLKQFAKRSALRDRARSWHVDAGAFVVTIKPERLGEPMVAPWARFYEKHLGVAPSVTTFGETLFQVWAHTAAHRAQINTRLRDLGHEPPLVDYIAWLWGGRP